MVSIDPKQWERQAYGTTEAEMERMLARFGDRRPAEVEFAVSVLSDVQELVAQIGGMEPAKAEEARQYLNRAKWALLRVK